MDTRAIGRYKGQQTAYEPGKNPASKARDSMSSDSPAMHGLTSELQADQSLMDGPKETTQKWVCMSGTQYFEK